MILNDEDIKSRLESPLNLINRLNSILPKSNAMDVFVPSGTTENDNPPAVPSEDLEEIVDEKKLRLGLVRSLALDVLHSSLEQLSVRLPEVDKVKDLSQIARDMKTVLTEEEDTKRNNHQVIIYKPIINDISKYDTMVVME